MGLLHKAVSHVAPGAAQIPQLGLQHTMPELHVFGPHSTLSSTGFTLRVAAAEGAGLGVCALLGPCGVCALPGACGACALLGACGAGNAGTMTGAAWAVPIVAAGVGSLIVAAGAATTGATTAGEVAT